MAKQTYTKGVTPVGEALFAHLLKTEVFKKDNKETDTGKFTVMVKFKESEKDYLLASIKQEWEKFKETLVGKKLKYDPVLGIKEYQEEEYFKFSMNESIRCKSGEVIHKTVPIFDASGKEISKKLTSIGNGTKLRIAYELVPFHMSDKNYGISLRLTGVQIIDLVEYGEQSASALGFSAVAGGFVADEAMKDTDEEADADFVNDDMPTDGDF